MSDNTEYIDSYFQYQLNSEERKTFEQRCETDNAFANEVAIYIASRKALYKTLLEQKMQQWKTEEITEKIERPVISMSKRTTFSKWLMYAAAACILLVVSMLIFEKTSSTKNYASNYFTENYSTLAHTMDASHDSMQLGISAYNDKDFTTAIRLFEGVAIADPNNSDAIKYAGLTYFQQKNYTKAIEKFNVLSTMQLFSNPGDFLKALTLLERNNKGDKEQAKTLLEKVKSENEEGSNNVDEILKKY
ncbi:MAG: tetratricopeptide repeat protein [Bacteroidetes bacterium]|nr:tetratricopeptide repeat protein [Bacteroidota bacterium]